MTTEIGENFIGWETRHVTGPLLQVFLAKPKFSSEVNKFLPKFSGEQLVGQFVLPTIGVKCEKLKKMATNQLEFDSTVT